MGGYAQGEGLLFRLPASDTNPRNVEVEAIRQALALAGDNKSQAARQFGLTRDTLLYRMKMYLIKARADSRRVMQLRSRVRV